MMFVENKSIHYIEADAQDVSALYRSTATVLLAQGGKERQPCEAFICAVQDGASSTVYVALSLHKSRNFVIFSPGQRPDGKENQEDLIREALAMVKEWGFDMQSVNLNYSKALKEVVLNDLRVVRHPHSARKAAQKRGAGERQARSASQGHGKEAPAETGENAPVSEGIPESSGTPVRKMTEKGQTGAERIKHSKDPVEKGGGESDSNRTVDTASRQGDVKGQVASKDAVLPSAKGPGAIEEAKSVELASLKAEMERISREKSAAVSRLDSELEEAREEFARSSEENELEQRKASEQLLQLRSRLQDLNSEKRAAEAASAREIAVLGAEIEKVAKERECQEKEALDEIENLKAKLKGLSEAKSDEKKRRAKEAAALRHELEELSTDDAVGELLKLRAEVERLTAEKSSGRAMAESEQSALREEIQEIREEKRKSDEISAKELAMLKAELEGLLTERQADESDTRQQLTAAKKELERLKVDRSRDEEGAAGELAMLRDEIARMVEENSAANAALAGTISDLEMDVKRLVAEKDAAESAAAEERATLSDAIRVQKKELSDSKELAARQRAQLLEEAEILRTERAAAEKMHAAETSRLQQEILGLKEDAQSSRDAAEAEIDRLRSELERLSAEKGAQLANASSEIAGLREESERLLREKEEAMLAAGADLEAARGLVVVLSDEIRQIRSARSAELSTINAEIERLTLEKESVEKESAEQLGSATTKAAQLAADLLETEIGVIEKTSAARSAACALLKAVSGGATDPEALVEGSDVFVRIEGLLEEADRLAEEKAKAEDSALGQLASLKAQVARLESEKHAAKKAAAAEAEGLKAEVRRLNAEREEADRVDGERLARLAAEVERLAKEADAAREAASARMARLKTETAALEDVKRTFEKASVDVSQAVEISDLKPAGDRNTPVSPDAVELLLQEGVAEVHEPPSTFVAAPVTAQPEDSTHGTGKASDDGDVPDPFAFLSQGDEMMGNVRSFAVERTGPPVRFSIDRALQAIDFVSLEDVLEIHQSLNRTRVAMEDNTTVTCDSFLCAVRKDGKPHVYIALYQVDSKMVLVYTPEKQPEDSQEFEKVMRDGMDFIEIVGFMMDGVDLGKDNGGRAKVFSRIPVLRQVS